MNSTRIWRRFVRPGELYVALCLGLALLVVFVSDSYIPFSMLFVAQLPLSIVAWGVSFFGGVLLFGPSDPNVLGSAFFVVVWGGCAAAQMLLIRVLLNRRQQGRAVHG